MKNDIITTIKFEILGRKTMAKFNSCAIDKNTACDNKYLGHIEGSYAAYSTDKDIRSNAASGGVVTSTLVYMLKTKQIDGALVSRQRVENGKISVESFIATTKEELQSCQSSIYIDFNMYSSLTKIKDFDGKLAIVCLPCHLKSIATISKKQGYEGKIKYKLCLFCGGVAKDTLMYRILENNKIDINQVTAIYYRKGHWRGNTIIEMKTGEKKEISYKYNWCTYKNAFFYSSEKCFACDNLFGLDSDFSFGDIWLSEMRENPIKHTAILARNASACKILNDMAKDKAIELCSFPVEKIQAGNKRALVYKYKTAQARAKIGKKYGFTGPKTYLDKSKWNHYIASRLIIKNMVLSKSESKMNRIFKINKKIMYVYMGIIRVLLSF